jgi:hypothetical protein
MTELADDLFAKVFSELPDYETLKRVSDSLPNLLRGFALKLGGENQAPINREIMAFVHKKRRLMSALIFVISIPFSIQEWQRVVEHMLEHLSTLS